MDFNLPREVDTLKRSEEGVSFPILSPLTGDPIKVDGTTPFTITACGSDSERYANAVLEADRKALKIKESGSEYPTNERVADILAAVTTGWTGVKAKDGGDVAFTAANARLLYLGAPEVRDQIFARVTRRVNFIKASSDA